MSHTAATMGAKAGLFNQATGMRDLPHMCWPLGRVIQIVLGVVSLRCGAGQPRD